MIGVTRQVFRGRRAGRYEKTNILFLAPLWRVSLIKSFHEAMDRLRPKGRLVGADSDPDSAAFQILKFNYKFLPCSEPYCSQSVLDICRKENIRANLPLMNKAIEFLHAKLSGKRSV